MPEDRSGACLAAFAQLAGRFVGLGRIILRRAADDDTHYQAYYHGQRDAHPVVHTQQPEDEERSHYNKDRTEVGAEAQGAQQVLHRRILLGTHGKDADDGEQDAHGGNQHRGDNRLILHRHVPAVNQHRGDNRLILHRHVPAVEERRRAQSCRGKDGAAIALIEVGTHTGYVAHIVAHVVGNGGRITHQVGAHVGGFGIDTAAHTGKQGLRRGAHTEGQHRGGNDTKFIGGSHQVFGNDSVQQKIPERNIQQTQAYDHQPHHRTATEGDAKSRVQRVTGGIGGTRRSIRGGLHAQEARQTGEETARQEGDGHPMVLHVEAVGHNREEDDQPQEDETYDFILLFQVRHSPLAHGGGYLLHLRCTFALLHHLPVEMPGKGESQYGCGRYEPEKHLLHGKSLHFKRLIICGG